MHEEEMVEKHIQTARICRLFRAVLKRAACDAFGPKSRSVKRKKIRDQARAFLSDNDDFRLICQMAFVDFRLILKVVNQTKLQNIEKYKQIILNIEEKYHY